MGCKGGTERPLDHIEQPTRIALNLLTALVMTVSPHSLHVGHSPTVAHSVGTSKSVFLLFILLLNASLIIMGFETMNIINVSLITFPLARARVRLHLISPRGRGTRLGLHELTRFKRSFCHYWQEPCEGLQSRSKDKC